ncbi:RNA-directed DNA polymerase [Gregarina niphandrodes]|uniref:RNA-directed DNA polymerase n=1 Tax=Gregarina niphandrodes TaxID=110365 RepID=A0A023B0G9_GRENI|nr:RNA-directed DNA polymerase [Gregarina niphandrodes]EZG44956.1 RNA-directed DNA polymerase [Gregarina niphandrodes]|eukprot:XP_011132616.1 RNA-directed DNA polymerase [Gregarina niphandrodes]
MGPLEGRRRPSALHDSRYELGILECADSGGEQAPHRVRHTVWAVPFGIKNSPAEFQPAMDMLFEKVLDDRTLCYIDDIIIATDTVPEMMQRLEKVLRLCRERLLPQAR